MIFIYCQLLNYIFNAKIIENMPEKNKGIDNNTKLFMNINLSSGILVRSLAISTVLSFSSRYDLRTFEDQIILVILISKNNIPMPRMFSKISNKIILLYNWCSHPESNQVLRVTNPVHRQQCFRSLLS